jgi:hypothetical protein
VAVEIVTSVPPELGHCASCEVVLRSFTSLDRQFLEWPEDVARESAELVSFLRELSSRNPHVTVRVIPTLTPEGFMVSLRYGIKRTPAVIIRGRKVCEGYLDLGLVEEALNAHR